MSLEPKPNKSELAIEAVCAALREAGFVSAGNTPTQSYRTGSASSPIYGGIGGKLVNTGGRIRFAKPDSLERVTIGPRSVCFYEVVPGAEAKNFQTYATKDLAGIKTRLGLTTNEENEPPAGPAI